MTTADRKLVSAILVILIIIAIEIPLATISTPRHSISASLTGLEWPFDDANHLVAAGTLILATFATLQWVETRRTAKRQLRAYVSVLKRSIKFSNLLTFCTEIEFKNSGQTPAYKVSHLSKMFVQPPPGPTATDLPSFDHESTATATLGPGEETTLWDEKTLSLAELNDIQTNKLAIWVVGELRYRDAFGCKRYSRYKSYVDQSDLAIANDDRMNISDDGNDLT